MAMAFGAMQGLSSGSLSAGEQMLEAASGSRTRSISPIFSMSAWTTTREPYPLTPPPSMLTTVFVTHGSVCGKGYGLGIGLHLSYRCGGVLAQRSPSPSAMLLQRYGLTMPPCQIRCVSMARPGKYAETSAQGLLSATDPRLAGKMLPQLKGSLNQFRLSRTLVSEDSDAKRAL